MTQNLENTGGPSRNRWRIAAWSAAALLMLLPLGAMQVTDQVNWDGIDFAILGALLVGVGVTYELVARQSGNAAYRTAVGIALVAAFILIVGNLAVGIIGTEHNDANLMFGGVLAVGIIGAIIARLQPGGMACAMIAAAIAQVLVGVVALIAGFGSRDPNWPLDIVMATGFFAALWLLSARLFRKAAQEPSGN